MEPRREPGRYECKYCNVNYSSVSKLYQHMGWKIHIKAVTRAVPAGVTSVNNIQQFFDKYTKGEPVIVTAKKNKWHKVMEDKSEPLIYECKYCNVTSSSLFNLYQHMRRNNHILAVTQAVPEGVTSVDNIKQFFETYMKDEPMFVTAKINKQHPAMEEKKEPRIYECKYCNVNCQSASSLYQHVMGNKHKSSLRRTFPAELPHVHSLQHFLDTYVEDEPMLGLEYIVENHVGKYRCELCDEEVVKRIVVRHVTGPQHMQKYLHKHHPETAYCLNQSAPKDTCNTLLYSSALDIQLKHGRKKIQELKINNEGSTPAKVVKYCSSKTDLPSKEKDTVESSPTDLSRDRPSSQETELKMSTEHLERPDTVINEGWRNTKCLLFQNNDFFFDDLREFEIENDEDAEFIKQITQNFTKALMTFREELANVQGSLSTCHLASAHGEVTDQQCDSLQSVDKTVSLSPCAASLCKDSSTQEPGAVGKSDATQTFFSSIKHMEASEVVDVFEKFAATNPDFKGIDIPNMIKYLQDTGKLKKNMML